MFHPRRIAAALAAIALLTTHGRAEEPPQAPTVEGRFGQAFDASSGGFLAPADARYGQAPLTAELWARLTGRESGGILLSNEPTASGTHWELFAEPRTGNLGLRLPGARPPVVMADATLGDGLWHHLALVKERERVRLIVDGRTRLDERIERIDRPSQPGPLGVGTGVEDRTPSPVQIDDLRLSSIARDVIAAPELAAIKDERTIALFSFDESERDYLARWTPGGETNQRGLPYPHRIAEFEFETDDNWIDDRWQQTLRGPFLSHSILIPQRPTGPKGLAVSAGADRSTIVLYDLERCAAVAAAAPAELKVDAMRYGLLRKPTIEGPLAFYVPPEKTWRKRGTEGADELIPLDRSEADYQGLRLHGDRVVLESRVLGGGFVETAEEVRAGGLAVPCRTLRIERPTADAWLTLAEMPAATEIRREGGAWLAVSEAGDQVHALVILGPDRGPAPILRGNDVMLPIASGDSWSGRVLGWSGSSGQLDAFVKLAKSPPETASLDQLQEPAAGRWGEPLVTAGQVAAGDGPEPYVIDTVRVPYENPFHALFFISAFDFFRDGSAALATAHGDVWLVDGLDAELDRVTWRRFATGLYQPLGLKVVDGKVIVLGRDQLTRLHDENGDGEADRYESFNHDLLGDGQDHAFAMRLETDSKGRFYFLKSGAGPHGSALLRVGADGRGLDVAARGFRHPYGLGIGPADQITVADNEGNWVPSSKIDLIREGGFYGFLGAAGSAPPGVTPEPPLCYIPKVADNSCGGQTWVTSDRWGDYHRGGMLHLSWGRCTLHAVLQDLEDGSPLSAATVRFPDLTFLSGSGEAAFSPKDGQLYVSGLDGWQTGAVADGSFQRVRVTGKPIHMPESVRAYEDGLLVTFSRPIDPETARDPGRFRVETWSYRWSPTYGSFHYRPSSPEAVGHDVLTIESAEPQPDGRSVFLRVPGLSPVDQLQLSTDLKAADGAGLRFDVYATIHKLRGPHRPE